VSAFGRIVVLLALGVSVVGSTMAAPSEAPSLNGRIAFTSAPGGNREIYTVDPDGSRLRRLTRDVRDDYAPAFSPDGRSIAFVRGAERPELFLMGADGGGVKRLVAWRAGGGYAPSWSPDGSRIVFVSHARGGLALKTIRADGTGLVRLPTPVGWFYDHPAWSPDGRSLVFTGGLFGSVEEGNVLNVVALGGRRPRPLLELDEDESQYPEWSPFGDRISFVRVIPECGGICRLRDLWSVSPSGRDARQLVSDVPDAAWSPDGTHLVVLGREASPDPERERWDLRIVSSEGTTEQQLVVARGAASPGLSWQPRCTIVGSLRGDRLRGAAESDLVCGFGGPDRLVGGPGRDRLLGADVVRADRSDYVGVDCERVTRR
jgi:Tol biopolymer transport system component